MGRKKKKKGFWGFGRNTSNKTNDKKNDVTKKDNDGTKKIDFANSLNDETREGIVAILFFLVSIFLMLSPFELAGRAGDYTYTFFYKMFGFGYYLIPIILTSLGILYIKSYRQDMSWYKNVGAVIFVASGIGILDLLAKSGGLIGYWIGFPLLKYFGIWFSTIALFCVLLISILITFNTAINFQKIFAVLTFWRKRKDDDDIEDVEVSVAKSDDDDEAAKKEKEDKKSAGDQPIKIAAAEKPNKNSGDKKPGNGLIFFSRRSGKAEYKNPPLSLLDKDSGKPGVGDIKANANIIRRTLMNFGIQVEMDEVSVGPSVTRYALKPAEGVKLSKIVALQNDLALALAAHPLRIEAPIPGKSLVGIEIPNSTKTKVGLGTMLKNDDFTGSDKALLVGMGKGVTGKSYFANLGKAPHMLIAGATGSGKSVTIHALITSLLYRNSPEMLKFIMVDPKRVELTLYNKIPHLLTPVITDPKKTILALKWAAKEMNRRYDVLQGKEVRDIESYHKNILQPALKKRDEAKGDTSEMKIPETMPFIVIVIDELADIMQAYPRELEAGIVRLAQMSRAVGIHLIISTQRPSVNVITGLIKANIPTRVALQVASQIDSRTILDMPGAEKLLGQGDMLYMGGEMSQPVRVQSAFISENEVKAVVDFLAEQFNDELPESDIDLEGVNEKVSIFDAVSRDDASEEDDLYGEAKEVVIEAGKASTSYLQRKLGIGYSRAAKIIDLLEENGVVGPANGSKPREIMVGADDGDAASEMDSAGSADSHDSGSSSGSGSFGGNSGSENEYYGNDDDE